MVPFQIQTETVFETAKLARMLKRVRSVWARAGF